MLAAWWYHFAVAFFQAGAPARSAGRHRPVADRTTVGMAARKARAAEEAEPRVIEIVAVDVVERHRRAGRTHERIELLVLEEHRHAHAGELVAVVLAHRALAGLRIVGLADAGVEQQGDVAEHVGREHDHAGRLLVLLAGAGVGVDDAGDLLGGLVVDHPADPGAWAQRELRFRAQQRQDADQRAPPWHWPRSPICRSGRNIGRRRASTPRCWYRAGSNC